MNVYERSCIISRVRYFFSVFSFRPFSLYFLLFHGHVQLFAASCDVIMPTLGWWPLITATDQAIRSGFNCFSLYLYCASI